MTAPVKEGQFVTAFSDVIDSAVAEFGNVDVNQPPTADGVTPVPATPTDAPPAPPVAAVAPDAADAPVDPAATVDPVAPPVDPLAGSEPFTYGTEGRVIEGVYRFPGEGLMIPEDKVGVLEALANERDQMSAVLPQAFQELSGFTAISRYAFSPGDDAQGNPLPDTVLEGRAGIEMLHVHNAMLRASLKELLDGISDPIRLLGADPNDPSRVVWDAQAIENLRVRSELAQERAERTVRAQLGASVHQALTPAPQPIDYSASAPHIMAQSLQGTTFKISALTADDKAELQAILPRFVRATTPQERANGYAPASIVDAQYGEMVVNRAKLRASAAQQTTTAERAARVNATANQARQPQPTSQPQRPQSMPSSAAPAKPRSYGAQSADLVDSALADLGLAH